jgi:hypothetical protein
LINLLLGVLLLSLVEEIGFPFGFIHVQLT